MSSFAGLGWVALRRALLEHVGSGLIGWAEYTLLVTILLLADARTGRWRGSAPSLTTILGFGSKNTAAEALEKLEGKGYILRDYIVGSKGNYPIVIDKFEITIGPSAGKRVDLRATKQKYGIPNGNLSRLKHKELSSAISQACKSPVLALPTDEGFEGGDDAGCEQGVGCGEVSTNNNIQKINEKNGEREGERSFALARPSVSEQEAPASGLGLSPERDSDTESCSAPVQPSFPEPDLRSVKSELGSVFAAEPPSSCAAALRLAHQFFHWQGRPARSDNHDTINQWTAAFDRMIVLYGLDDVEGAMRWAFETDGFWPTKLVRTKDPLGYFTEKLDEQIMPRFRAWKTATIKKNKKKPRCDEGSVPSTDASGQSLAAKWGGKVNE